MSATKTLAKKLPADTIVYRCGDTKGKSCGVSGQLVAYQPCTHCVYKQKKETNAGDLKAGAVVILAPEQKN